MTLKRSRTCLDQYTWPPETAHSYVLVDVEHGCEDLIPLDMNAISSQRCSMDFKSGFCAGQFFNTRLKWFWYESCL